MRNSRGFSLQELMIAVAIFTILSSIAIPSYIKWLPKRHLRSSAMDIQSAINLAKATAIRENADAVMTFDPANDSYLIYVDTDADGNQDSDERTLRNKSMSTGIALNNTTIPGDKLTFNSRGLADASGNITLINKHGENRVVSVTISGMSRIN